MNVLKHLDIMLGATAVLATGVNFVYFQKRISEIQNQIDDIQESNKESSSESSKINAQLVDTIAAINGMQAKLVALTNRIENNEEDGISLQEDVDNYSMAVQEWSKKLIDDLKTVKPDIALTVAPGQITEDAHPPQRGNTRSSRAHHHHHHAHSQALRKRTRGSAQTDDDDDQFEERFRSRRRH